MGESRREYRLGEIVALLGGDLRGSGEVVVDQVASLESAGPRQIAFLGREAYRRAMNSTRAAALVTTVQQAAAAPCPCILADNPYGYFIRVATLLNPPAPVRAGIHQTAIVHPRAMVAATSEIGEFVTIGDGAYVGDAVRIGPGCRVGANARIGDGSHLHANVTIYDHCCVGRRAVLNAGCVIGADGFGGAMENGRWLKMPHIGRVVIGDDVEVGANTTIDRGALGDTVIGDGVKLDNQIQVGHNVRIGAHTSIAGCTGIAGSAVIGAHCVIGGGANILGHLHIADGVQISACTTITRSIDTPGRYSGIYPMSEHRAWLRGAVRVRKLAEDGNDARSSAGAPDRTDETG